MAAPTTTPTNGAGTITATGEDNGLLVAIGATTSRPRLIVGFSGTYTSPVVAVRGRLRGLTNYYPVLGKRRGTGAPVGNSASVSLTTDTAEALEFDLTGCDYAEVYCVSGTPTDMAVEVRVAPADPGEAPVIQVNQSAANVITSSAAAAFAVGANGSTNPVLQVDANTASVATGLKVTGAAAASGVALAVVSSGTNESLTVNAKGSGTITLQSSGTGNVLCGTSLLVTGATKALGYGTGSGGAVTQASSRTTGVTVNAGSGAITLVSAAGSTTPATFTVTNSVVAATDTVVVSQKSGTDLYTISVSKVQAGSFDITFNTKSGTTTEQPVFSFAVVKAVAS